MLLFATPTTKGHIYATFRRELIAKMFTTQQVHIQVQPSLTQPLQPFSLSQQSHSQSPSNQSQSSFPQFTEQYLQQFGHLTIEQFLYNHLNQEIKQLNAQTEHQIQKLTTAVNEERQKLCEMVEEKLKGE